LRDIGRSPNPLFRGPLHVEQYGQRTPTRFAPLPRRFPTNGRSITRDFSLFYPPPSSTESESTISLFSFPSHHSPLFYSPSPCLPFPLSPKYRALPAPGPSRPPLQSKNSPANPSPPIKTPLSQCLSCPFPGVHRRLLFQYNGFLFIPQ